MINKYMRSRLLKNILVYVILILYVLIPMLDRTVCPDCLSTVPLQGTITIGHLQASHDDVSCFSKEDTQSKTPGTQNAKSYCSICANVLMGVEVSSPNPRPIVAQHDGPQVVPILSELHYSIDKPPQNLLA